MKYEEVKGLIEAGFTKDEILKLLPEEEDAPAAPEKEEAPALEEEEKQEYSLDALNKEFSAALANFKEEMAKLTKEMKDNNILLSSMKDADPAKTGEELIAEIIAPAPVETEMAKQIFGGKTK